MDLVASCKDKLAYFRIKELKDVLTQLGLPKQGKKQDLVDRILAILTDEQLARFWPKKNAISRDEVAKLVDDTYRKMQNSGATDLASKGQGVLESSNTKVKGESEDSFHLDVKVRCLCGNSLETDSMIKCEDPRCQVWQHIGCVIIPEKPMEGNPQYPDLFYCEICRLSRADPFWVTVTHPLYPVKLVTTNVPTDGLGELGVPLMLNSVPRETLNVLSLIFGAASMPRCGTWSKFFEPPTLSVCAKCTLCTNPMQSVDKTFHLTRADRDLLTKQEYEVQAWCMLLNDKVSFRMQWPQYADLQVNGVSVRPINRPGSQLLGANGRDDGPIITPCTKDGINKISLTGCDARIFCLGIRIVKRRTVQQILNLIPKESDGEPFEDALARVRRCIGGGTAADNADGDSDIEVVADSFDVNLRCPMSGSRMKVAGRFKPCIHMGCFDLEVFVEMNQRSRKWQCPICVKNYSLEHVIIDPYFNRLTTMTRHCGEDVTEIDVKPDGSWRVKSKTEAERRELGELAQWHNPNGTLCGNDHGELNPTKVEMAKQIKQEGYSEGHAGNGLKLGIRKNRNGLWEVSKPEDINTSSSGNQLQEKFENNEQKVIRMSSSATGSGRDGDDPSVNQVGGGNFDVTNNGMELDSLSLNVDSAYGVTDRNFSVPSAFAEVIVLSDSDDDNDILVSSGSAYNSNRADGGGASFSVPPPVIGDAYPEDPTIGNGGNSCLGLFNATDDEFGMPLWPLPQGTHTSFQLFSSDVSDPLADLQHAPINCPTSMNGYGLAPDTAMGSASLVPDSSVGRSDDGLVDNPLAFGGEDPSLQIFLPTRPYDASVQSNVRDQADVSNGVRTDDWISLRLGGAATGSHNELASSNGLNSTQQMPSGEGAMDSMASLANTASLLLGMSDGRSEKASRQRSDSDSPFSFPRQKRSVRQRLYLSIDSDSDEIR